MGIARRKKLAGEAAPTEKKVYPKKERGRRSWNPAYLAYEPVGNPQLDELGPEKRRFMAIRDGTVYELLGGKPSNQRVKVTDDVVIGRVHKTLGIISPQSESLK